MLYKKNYKQVISRLSEFYTGKGKDQIYAVMGIQNPVLQRYAIETVSGEVPFPDLTKRIRFWDALLSCYTDLEDDSIPAAYLTELDMGLYGGLLGGEVRFLNTPENGWISSMSVPFWNDLSRAEKLKLPDSGNLWYDRMIHQMEMYTEECRGKYGCSHFICINSLNFLFELRGATNAYYDVIEEPELARKVLDYSVQLNRVIQDAYFGNVGLFEGGTVSTSLQWIPGRIISESVDPYHMTNQDFFENAGREYIERLISYFDGAVIHVHANGYGHMLPYVSTIKNLKALLLGDDPYNPRAIDRLDALLPLCRDIPLVICSVPYFEFLDMMKCHKLPGNILYYITEVPSIDEANRTMEVVRTYRV